MKIGIIHKILSSDLTCKLTFRIILFNEVFIITAINTLIIIILIIIIIVIIALIIIIVIIIIVIIIRIRT